MKILYVDTTTSDLVVAVIEENSILDFSISNCGVRHSETLCTRVSEALNLSEIEWNDLDAYACAVGPGSFTGIRIGIATLKGYKAAVPKPFLSVNSLENIAYSQNCGSKKCAIIDAGNGYYFADFAGGLAPCLISYDDVRAEFSGRCNGGAQCVDGAAYLLRKRFAQKLFVDELTPLYIRRSQVEERSL